MGKKDKKGFGKHQFIASEQFRDQRDLLNALLEDGKTYTPKQVQKLINDFLLKEAK